MSDVLRILTVTQANLDHHHLYLSDIRNFFPADSIGGASKTAAGQSLRIEWGDGDVIETDIAGDKFIFRRRGWLAEFFKRYDVRPGDELVLERLGSHAYRLSPLPMSP